jgi:hypothetical protein
MPAERRARYLLRQRRRSRDSSVGGVDMDIVPGLGMAKAIRPLQDYHPLAPQLGRCNVSPTRRIAARRHARILDGRSNRSTTTGSG